MGAAGCQPGITGNFEVIDKEGAALLHGIHGQRNIPGVPADTTKRLSILGVGLGSDQLAIRGQGPIIGAAGAKKCAADDAKRMDELARFAALKRGTGKLQKKPLEGRLRLRRVIRTRISRVTCQGPPII
jgi:hypothetical protein